MTNEKQVCCGPTVRKDGNTYLCQRCDSDLTEKFRSAGMAGQVVRWIGRDRHVIDENGKRRP